MPKDPAYTAAADQLLAAIGDLHDYMHSLDGPDLLAELRCTLGRLTIHAENTQGALSPLAVNLSVLSEGLSRFDVDGAVNEDGTTDPGWRPLPGAIKAADECACHTPHGGARGRAVRVHSLGHTAADRFRA